MTAPAVAAELLVWAGDAEDDLAGQSLAGRCGHCGILVDNHDPNHRVSSIMRGGRGVECVLRGDIRIDQAQPLGPRT